MTSVARIKKTVKYGRFRGVISGGFYDQGLGLGVERANVVVAGVAGSVFFV